MRRTCYDQFVAGKLYMLIVLIALGKLPERSACDVKCEQLMSLFDRSCQINRFTVGRPLQ